MIGCAIQIDESESIFRDSAAIPLIVVLLADQKFWRFLARDSVNSAIRDSMPLRAGYPTDVQADRTSEWTSWVKSFGQVVEI